MAQADNIREIEDVPEYTTEKKTETRAEQRFRFDGDLYTLRRPKSFISIYLLNLAEGGTEAHTSSEIGMDMLNLTRSIIQYIKEESPDADGNPRGRAKLLNRLNDPDDDLDLIDLTVPFNELMNKVFNRPTGPRPASTRKPRARSVGSGGNTRSRRAVTSGS